AQMNPQQPSGATASAEPMRAPPAANDVASVPQQPEVAVPAPSAPAPSVPLPLVNLPPATAPATQIVAMPPGIVPAITPITDAEVGDAIKRAADFLIDQFKNGVIPAADATSDAERAGIDALCLYALLQTSRASTDPRLSIKGEFLKE